MARMSTVEAEANLYARMRRCTERELGPGADEAEIQKLAERYYWDDEDEHFREETPEEIQAREAEVFRAMRRIRESGGVPW